MLEFSAVLCRMNQTARIEIGQAPLHYRAIQRMFIAALRRICMITRHVSGVQVSKQNSQYSGYQISDCRGCVPVMLIYISLRMSSENYISPSG